MTLDSDHRAGAPARLIPRTGDVIDRRDMTDGSAIEERMARDILAARRAGQTGIVDLTEHGWTLAQAMRWGAIARELAGTVAFATHDVVVRLREQDEAVEAAVTHAIAAPLTGDMTAMVDHLEFSGDAA